MAGSPKKRARRMAQLSQTAGTDEEPRLDKNGKPLRGAAGRPMSEEMKERLAEARRAAKERGDWNGGRTKTKWTPKEVEEHHLDRLMPLALQVMELAMLGAIDRQSVDAQALKAAQHIYEQRHGKATQTQKVQAEQTTKIEYVASPYVFDLPALITEN